jgi:hypothetical protein
MCIHHKSIEVNPILLTNLIHLSDEFVDIVFPVPKITTLNEMLELACPPATRRVREFERPQEVRCLRTNISHVARMFGDQSDIPA